MQLVGNKFNYVYLLQGRCIISKNLKVVFCWKRAQNCHEIQVLKGMLHYTVFLLFRALEPLGGKFCGYQIYVQETCMILLLPVARQPLLGQGHVYD